MSSHQQINDMLRPLGRSPVFVSLEGLPVVSLPYAQGHQVFPIDDPIVRDWLADRYNEEYDDRPSRAAIEQCVSALRARALMRSPSMDLALRVGRCSKDGAAPTICIDLANGDDEIIEIAPGAWNVT